MMPSLTGLRPVSAGVQQVMPVRSQLPTRSPKEPSCLNHPVTSVIEWRGQATAEGVIERSFMLSRRSGAVPGVLWSPGTLARPPAVLLGHGGSGHKRSW